MKALWQGLPVLKYFKKAFIDGFIVLATFGILFFVFKWLFGIVMDLVKLPTELLLKYVDIPEFVGAALVLIAILAACFFVGNIIRTWLGRTLYELFEKKFPFYKTVKEILTHIFGEGKFLSCPVALAEPFPGTWGTALVMEMHESGIYTVFIPTAPNPTTGYLWHLSKEKVHILPGVTKEVMFRSVVACGLGSRELIEKFLEAEKKSDSPAR